MPKVTTGAELEAIGLEAVEAGAELEAVGTVIGEGAPLETAPLEPLDPPDPFTDE